MVDRPGEYENVFLNFYQQQTELSGTYLTTNTAPRHIEFIGLSADSIEFLATLNAHTASMSITKKNNKLSGFSYYDKPMHAILKLELRNEPDWLRWFEPKEIRSGGKFE